MSQSEFSTTEVVKVKGVALNYLQFLWGNTGIQGIREAQMRGDYAGALTKATELIRFLPDSIKQKYREMAEAIDGYTRLVALNKVTVRDKDGREVNPFLSVPDLFMRLTKKRAVLREFSRQALLSFMDTLTSELNRLGYMENIKFVMQAEMEVPEEFVRMREAMEKEQGEGKPAVSGTID